MKSSRNLFRKRGESVLSVRNVTAGYEQSVVLENVSMDVQKDV